MKFINVYREEDPQMSMAQGKVVQCIGAVVDIQFPHDGIPKIYDALTLDTSAQHDLIER
jgi:F-type H+/Na+-transporting ATPase subunit beta